ncbi:MAG TPA: DUF4255 domain-containing protein [Rhodothermales bacterium]
MADFRAIEGVSSALVQVLKEGLAGADLGDVPVLLFGTDDFARPLAQGVSVFLYRVSFDPTVHMRSEGPLPDESSAPPLSALELRYLLTIWADDPHAQLQLAGYVIERLERTPVITHDVLSAAGEGVFEADETVHLLADDLSTKDLLRIWTSLGVGSYRLSLPYLARGVKLQSLGGNPAAPTRPRRNR